jgi:hypothetical protein
MRICVCVASPPVPHPCPYLERLASFKLRPSGFIDAVDNFQIQGVEYAPERHDKGLHGLSASTTCLSVAQVKMVAVRRNPCCNCVSESVLT